MAKPTDQRYMQLAATPDLALAASFFGAFGFSMIDTIAVIEQLAKEGLTELGAQCVVAGVQIRSNTTFVKARGFERIQIFTIASMRPGIVDSVNFKAMHVVGHALAALAKNHALATKVSAKGNCVTGGAFPDTQAGKINKEIHNSLDGVAEFAAWAASDNGAACASYAVGVFEHFEAKRKELAPSKAKSATKALPQRPVKPVADE